MGAPPLPPWLAFSLGRGIPERQGMPAIRLRRDFPPTPHPSPSSRHSFVSTSQAAPLHHLPAQLSHSGVLAPPGSSQGAALTQGCPRSAVEIEDHISKGTLGEFKMNFIIIMSEFRIYTVLVF